MKQEIQRIFHPSILWGTAYKNCTFALQLFCAWLVSRVLETAITEDWARQYMDIGVAALSILLGGIILSLLSQRCAQTKMDNLQQFRQEVCLRVINGELDIPSSGELDVRLHRSAETIQRFFSDTCPQMIAAILTALVSFTTLCSINLRIGFIMLGLSMLQLLPTLLYEKWTKKIYAQTQTDEEAYCNWIMEGIKGISTIKAYQQETWFIRQFQKRCESLIRSGMKENGTAAIEDTVTELIKTILNYGSYLIIGAFILFCGINAVQLPLLLVLAPHLFSSAASIVRGIVDRYKYQQALEGFAMRKNIRIRRTVYHSPVAAEASHIQKSYDGKTVLADISFKILQNDRILLCGENGAGKTTLLRILLGLCSHDQGILLQGGQSIAFALQEDPLLPFSAQETADWLIQDGIIEETMFYRHMRAFGNSAMLSQTLDECSAGQRKKFFLSVALAKNAAFLILDEPTNHLDADSTAYLLEQLSSYSGTLLVCTHDQRLCLPWSHVFQMKEGMLYEA
ncbi:MAG: ABC transporter transmembrane domain-containing protein [Clostridia bacterium]|nr:ABC transporter transmembrane domain-containing protein [Clostridia bacterium]